jgi:myo-inositol-1(or 4)-monophosphatase
VGFDPLDGTPTTRTGCRSSARRWRSRSTAAPRSAAIFDPSRNELFTAERGPGCVPDGTPLAVSATDLAIDACAGHRFPYDVHAKRHQSGGLFGGFSSGRGGSALGSAALDLCYVAAGRVRRLLGAHLKPWDVAAGRPDRERGRRRFTGMDGSAVRSWSGASRRVEWPRARRDAST